MAHVGKAMVILILLFEGSLFTGASHDVPHCKVEDFSAQENFNEDRFQGKWYEASWILLPWIKPEWNYFDFINNYTKTDYGFSVFANGRWPYNATDCATPTTPRLLRTGESGKYIREYVGENKMLQNSTYWIMDTDYDNYALIIGCREVAPNGTCIAPDGWVWTRCPNPPARFVEYMEKRLPDFCLSKDMFYQCYHNTECRADISDSCTPEDMGGAGYRIQIAALTITAPILSMAILTYLL